MVTKIYKLELMVVDHGSRRLDDIIRGIEDCKYIHPNVMSIEERVVEWDDNHPLNKTSTSKQTFKELFSDEGDQCAEEYNRALDQQIDFD